MAGLSLLTAGASLMNVRRIGTGIISKALRKEDEKLAGKKHPERVQYITNVISQKKADVQRRFEKKFPTKTQRIKDKKIKKEYRTEIRQKTKDWRSRKIKGAEREKYESDPIYRASTIPRQSFSDTQLAFAVTNPLLPGMRHALRKEAKYGKDIMTRSTSQSILKRTSNFIFKLRNLDKKFTPKGRKWLKKREMEDLRAKLTLSGDV